MTDVFARAGEPVTTEDDKVICYVKNDLARFTPVKASDFHNFTEGEPEWKAHTPVDPRCTRSKLDTLGGLQICINGEWRP